MRLEKDYWYKEAKPKKLDDAKYLYKCKYTDPRIAVLEKYYDGALVSSFSTPIPTKKYVISEKNSINQRVDFYKNDKFNALCEIGDHLLEIKQKINIIDDLNDFFAKCESKPDYIPSFESKKIDKEYEELKSSMSDYNQLDEITRFFNIV